MVDGAGALVGDPVEFGAVDDPPGGLVEHPRVAHVDDHQPDAPDVAHDAEAVVVHAGRGQRGSRRPAVHHLATVGHGGQLVQQALGADGRRRQVAEVLVQPVGDQAVAHVVRPPRPGLGALDPCPRDVPVIGHLVVVEDHDARHRRQEPALEVLGPRLLVQPGRLLEAADEIRGQILIGRRLGPIGAPAGDALPRRRGGVIGVHLVAEEHGEVGPFLGRSAGHPRSRTRRARRRRARGGRSTTPRTTAARAARRSCTIRTPRGSERCRGVACGSCSAADSTQPRASTARRRARRRSAWWCPAADRRRRRVRSDARRRRTSVCSVPGPPPCTPRRSPPRSSPQSARRNAASDRAPTTASPTPLFVRSSGSHATGLPRRHPGVAVRLSTNA